MRSRFLVFVFALLLSSNISLFSQVGVNTDTPSTMLDINGALSLRAGTALSLTNNNNTNIALGTTPYSYYQIDGPTADFNINSIVRETGADGQLVILENNTTHSMTIKHRTGGNGSNRINCPGERDIVLTGRYSTVTLLYSDNNNKWSVINYSDQESPISSVSLATDETLDSSTFALVPGMTLTFTARKTAVLVMLTASGYGEATDPLSFIELRVLNGGTSLGGTQSNIHATSRPGGTGSIVYTSTWSATFSKLLSGLTIGTAYTLTAEARLDGEGSIDNEAFIDTISDPDASHLTLSVIH